MMRCQGQVMPFVTMVVIIACSPVLADDTRVLNRQYTETQRQEIKAQAAEWQLTDDEWVRYKELMRRARGTWSPDLDPLTALGAHATNDTERRRYAELFVRREFVRVEGELAFQRAVTQAWSDNFPVQRRLQAPRVQQANLLTSLDATTPVRYGLVLEPDCALCRTKLREYLDRVQNNPSLEALDIYLRNTGGDDRVLSDWASANAVPVDLVSATRITLNHGDQYQGRAPQVWALRKDGQWRSIQ